MKRFWIELNSLIKNCVLGMCPSFFFGWSIPFFRIVANTLSLSQWINRQKRKVKYNDFFVWKRNYNKRELLYEYVVTQYNLDSIRLDYIEFGVASGNSFRWWVNRLKNEDNRFFGFDTFEGLPEDWGVFSAGDMRSDIPVIDDNRIRFIKGLFQETLPEFLKNNNIEKTRRKIIHMDADLFSSTLFSLTSLAPFLNSGDILFFDEFNVPNHEFLAFKIFTESYMIKSEVLGAVNNFYQTGFIIV
jgi:hypothetical protein